MTRIIAGRAGGRKLATPNAQGVRPTTDRVREALFSHLEHEGAILEASVLDLYAGSGALGLEAFSRGARKVAFVESDRRVASIIRRNVRTLGFSPVRVVTQTVERFLAQPASEKAELVLADPPYGVSEEQLRQAIDLLVTNNWLRPRAVVAVERSSRVPEPQWHRHMANRDHRQYGETTMWYAEYQPPGFDMPDRDPSPITNLTIDEGLLGGSPSGKQR